MAQYKNSHLYKKAALTTDTIVRQNRGVEIDKTGCDNKHDYVNQCVGGYAPFFGEVG
jgi:hypothetical protein